MDLANTLKWLEEGKHVPMWEFFKGMQMHGQDFLIIDLHDIRQRAQEFQEVFDWIDPKDIRYASKANKYGEVLTTIRDQGLGFEVASLEEIMAMKRLGVEGKDIVFSNPGKHMKTLYEALEAGVRLFVTDSKDDLDTLSAAIEAVNSDRMRGTSHVKVKSLQHAIELNVLPVQANKEPLIKPDEIQILVRLQQAAQRSDSVDSCGSHLGLPIEDTSEKGYDALRAAKQAVQHGFKVVGSTFNAGTNQLKIEHWKPFIEQAALFARRVKETLDDHGIDSGIRANVLDMGGSFPAVTSKNVPELKEYPARIKGYIADAYFDNGLIASKEQLPRVLIEPGRSIAYPAHLFGSVIGVKPDLSKPGAFHAITTIGQSNSGVKVTLSNHQGDHPEASGFSIRALRFDHDKEAKTVAFKDMAEMSSYSLRNGRMQQSKIPSARFSLENPVTADVAKYAEDVPLPSNLKKGDVICVSGVGAYSDSFRGNWLQLSNPHVVIHDAADPDYLKYKPCANANTALQLAGIEQVTLGAISDPQAAGVVSTLIDPDRFGGDLLRYAMQHLGVAGVKQDQVLLYMQEVLKRMETMSPEEQEKRMYL